MPKRNPSRILNSNKYIFMSFAHIVLKLMLFSCLFRFRVFCLLDKIIYTIYYYLLFLENISYNIKLFLKLFSNYKTI
jgi:hypothetical protein